MDLDPGGSISPPSTSTGTSKRKKGGRPSPPIASDSEPSRKRKRKDKDSPTLRVPDSLTVPSQAPSPGSSPGYRTPMSVGALSDVSPREVSPETASEYEDEGTGARPKSLKTALITLIPPSIKGHGGPKATSTVESTVKGAVAKAKIPATMDAIAHVSKAMDEELIEEWKDHQQRKEGQNLNDPLEVVLTAWLMKYMWKQQHIGNVALADNEQLYGADATYVVKFVVNAINYVILVQFKTKHKSGINWTHANKKGPQLWLLLNRANKLRESYQPDTLVYAVFAAFTEHGILTYAAEDVALQFELLNPNSKTMDATVPTRRKIEEALELASPNPPGLGFLAKAIQLGESRKDKDLQKEAKDKIHELHPKAGGTSSKLGVAPVEAT
ncbi:hypothetical protein FRC17_010917 [Serendipita sp. 399]|nr:hypothetical protein FRC17_010917 [Serendipita sp. 399]